jgi:hypothetical protein
VLRLTLLASLVALAVPTAGLAGVGETSIFYYPWYGTPSYDGSYDHWSQDAHRPPSDIAANFYPLRGVYSSSNPSVVRAQMREIAGAGIREVVSSWWGWGSPEDRRLPLVISAAREFHLSVAVQIEPYEKWLRTSSVLAVDLAHLRDLGITRAYVFRPFDPLIDDGAWRVLNQDSGVQLLAQTGDVGRAAQDGFAGVYTYDIVRYGPGSFVRICAKAHALGLLCAPSVGPGYDATAATADTRVRPRRKGATYDAMWKAAVAARADRVTITSYNEWHEGTQIEPARAPGPERLAFTPLPNYLTYDGAWGVQGRKSSRAYLLRTAAWTKTYRAIAAGRRLLACLGLSGL